MKHLSPDSKQALTMPIFPELDRADETAWLEVVHRMEEVYNDVLRYQVELEEKNDALEEAQQFILSVLTSMSDVLIVCDKNGRVEEVNQALLTLLEASRKSTHGAALADLLADEESRHKAASFPNRLKTEGVVQDCEVLLRSSSGKSVPVSLNCSARFDNRGRQVGMVLVGRPTGELRRAYDALNKAHEQLKLTQQQLVHSEKMASLGRLVAGVAHELNNPISFVLGNVHALQRYRERLLTYIQALHQGKSAEECDALRKSLRIDRILADLGPLIEGTVEGAERTRNIVQDLKRFSAVDKEEDKVFNLVEVIHSAIHWVTRDAAPTFEVTTELPDEICVQGTEGQLHQVVVNLIQNAMDATAAMPHPKLAISAVLKTALCEIAFHDNGPGIEQQNLGRIFDPFFTTKPVGKGTGLGLSISYGLVERHGGKLTVANHPQGGAVFVLHLPLAAQT